MSDLIENKVAKSGLITLDLEELKPDWKIEGIDMKEFLWEGLVLKEKDFREQVKNLDWSEYDGKQVYIHCSTDAIIPTWAYMVMANALLDHAMTFIVGSRQELEAALWRAFISHYDWNQFKDQRVILKGCGDEAISESVYLEVSQKLLPHVKSLMFGEPCSTVPVFKR